MKISCIFLILDAQNCGLFANFALRLTDEAACRRVGKGKWRRKLACRWVGKGKREKKSVADEAARENGCSEKVADGSARRKWFMD